MQFTHHDPPRRICTKQSDGQWTFRVRNTDKVCNREHDEDVAEVSSSVIVTDAHRAWLDRVLAEAGLGLFPITVPPGSLPTFGIQAIAPAPQTDANQGTGQ